MIKKLAITVGGCLVIVSLLIAMRLILDRLNWDRQELEQRKPFYRTVDTRDDVVLVTRVREAVKKKLSAEKIEDFVGTKATINTLSQLDRHAFEFADISLDLAESQVDSFTDARHAVYWVRPLGYRTSKIVGVIWTTQNETKIFFGRVFPPGH